MKDFNNFVKRKIVKIQKSDSSRAEFLIKEADKGYASLQEMISKIGINENNANLYIKMCYDLIMEPIRAKMLLDGYNASGQGAHEAEIAYLKMLNFKEEDIKFADEIRFFRNSIVYYGTILDKEYAEKVMEFTKKMYKQLKEILSK